MIEIEKDGAAIDAPPRSPWQAMRRGLAHKCPACGDGDLFSSYLKVNDTCPSCKEELYHQRADDAPPYITIFIVGHIIIPGILILEKAYAPATWIHLVIWMPLMLILSLTILPRIKGLFVGLQWALGMHGFDKTAAPDPLELAAIPDPIHK